MKKNKTFKIVGVVFIITTIVCMVSGHSILRFLEIDSCLDKSGHWNYEQGKCEFKNTGFHSDHTDQKQD